MPTEKTIDDVTRDELAELAEATVDLIAAARFQFWEQNCEQQEKDQNDFSFSDAIERAARAVDRVGLGYQSQHDFEERLEDLLRSCHLPA